MRSLRCGTAASLVLTAISSFAAAQNSARDSAGDAAAGRDVPEIVVVASPIVEETRRDSFAFDTTVVSARQIEDLNALDLASALRRTPGVSISRFNPVGAFGGGEGGAVFIRGRGQSRPGADIQTYIDGVPVYMGVWNHPLLDILPVNAVDRVEVYKSPQPHRFGNAVAAVDLRTRRPTGGGAEGQVRAQAGSFSTRSVQGDQSWGSERWGLLLGGSLMGSDGDRPEGEGKLRSAFARVGADIGEHWGLDLLALASNNQASDPGPVGQPQLRNGQFATRMSLAALTLSHQHPTTAGEIKLYLTDGRGYWTRQANGSDTLTEFSGNGLRAREAFEPWRGGEVLLGLDLDRITGDVRFVSAAGVTSRFDGPTLRTLSPYVAISHRFELGGWTLTPSAGLRYYDHSEFTSQTSPHAGLVLARGPLALRANASRGVNYPGLEVIVLSSNVIPPLGQSWRNLTAERVDHWELGMSYEFRPGLEVDLAAFRDEGRNRYVSVPPPPPPPFWTNVDGADVRGLEASLNWVINPDWTVFAATTLLDPTPASLPYSPRHTHVLGLNGRVQRWRLSFDAQRVGSQTVLSQGRSALAANTQRVESFLIVNARVGYQPLVSVPGLELFVAGENLGDASYQYRPGYPMPGRWGMAGLSMRW
jgi:iron complex outermembrane receptor protein